MSGSRILIRCWQLAWAAVPLALMGCAPGGAAGPGQDVWRDSPGAAQNTQTTQAPQAAPAPAAPAPQALPPAGTAMQLAPAPAQAGGTHLHAGAMGLPDFSWLVRTYGAAVVNVRVVGRRSSGEAQQMSQDDPLAELFRRFGGPQGAQPRPRQPNRALGSGFIVSPDGYVLTNAHVVGEGGDVTVKLVDRREFPARVVGTDRRTDVAVLKIDGQNLPHVRFGDPARLEAGQWVAAIGSPFGLENSVTVGVVSATSRALGPDSSLVPFIQTDVAVNPGNSGGPLFNMNGEVVGINSQIYSQSGGYEGISFAIPIDIARNVQTQLVQSGHVTRGRLGVVIQDVNAQLAQSFKLDRPRGALVAQVEPNGPAAGAGIMPGDIILAVDGKPVDESAALPAMIAATRPGSNATLDVWRRGAVTRATARVAQLDAPEETARVAQPQQTPNSHLAQAGHLGLGVRPLTPAEQSRVQTEGRVVVEQAQGPAAAAGLQPGDIILAVGDTPVRSVEELRHAADSTRDSTVALLIQREDQRIFVPVVPGKRAG